jgi:hypothetical protein
MLSPAFRWQSQSDTARDFALKNCVVKRLLLSILITNLILSGVTNAGEVDHFSARSKLFNGYTSNRGVLTIRQNGQSFYELEQFPSFVILNELTNKILDKALEENNLSALLAANAQGNPIFSCETKNLATQIANTFDKEFIQKIDLLFRKNLIDSFGPDRESSIYSDLDQTDGPIYNTQFNRKVMNEIIKIGPYFVGTDKLDHFFEFGEYMFSIVGQNNDFEAPAKYQWTPLIIKNFGFGDMINVAFKLISWRTRQSGQLKDGFLFSLNSELGSHGLTSNGIKSYADMMANYKGLQFYQSLFDKKNPYFVCSGQSWERTERKFDWREHIDDAWDESINCNKYGSLETETKVMRMIMLRGFDGCPVVEESCKELGKKYKNIQEYVLNPDCHSQD